MLNREEGEALFASIEVKGDPIGKWLLQLKSSAKLEVSQDRVDDIVIIFRYTVTK